MTETKKQNRIHALTKTFLEFGNTFSGAGFGYVTKKGQHFVDRFFWLLTLGLFLALTIYFSYEVRVPCPHHLLFI